MYELIYRSKASETISNDMLQSILDISRKHNLEKNITGLLVFDGECFFQILEGRENVVKEVYSRIERDSRHSSVDVFHSGEIEERSFSQWAMSYKLLPETSQISGWIEWLDAQSIIKKITSSDTLGCRIFKLAYDI